MNSDAFGAIITIYSDKESLIWHKGGCIFYEHIVDDGVNEIANIPNEMVFVPLRMITSMHLVSIAWLTYANGQGRFILFLNPFWLFGSEMDAVVAESEQSQYLKK